MANNRVFYPCHQVGISGAVPGSLMDTFHALHGVQSVDITTSFSLEQVFEIGQLAVYENIEGVPNVEVTIEKLIDGYPTAYRLATSGASDDTLVNRTNHYNGLALSIFSDSLSSSSGTPLCEIVMPKMYLSNLSYSIPVDGSATESTSFMGNDLTWHVDSGFVFDGGFTTNTDTPVNQVMRRQHIVMGSGLAPYTSGSLFPQDISGIDANGRNAATGDTYYVHFGDISISASVGRNDILELGKKRPYYKYATFPVEVTSSFAVTAAGDNPGYFGMNADSEAVNLTARTIKIELRDDDDALVSVFDLGSQNKVSSITYGGGGTGGDNVTVTYNYLTYNDLTITDGNDF